MREEQESVKKHVSYERLLRVRVRVTLSVLYPEAAVLLVLLR